LQPIGDRVFNYRDTILLDYGTAFDPMQPETATLIPIWTCDPWFIGCSTLKLRGNSLNPFSLINTNRIVFNRKYMFNATIQNNNVRFPKSSFDTSYFQVLSPL